MHACSSIWPKYKAIHRLDYSYMRLRPHSEHLHIIRTADTVTEGMSGKAVILLVLLCGALLQLSQDRFLRIRMYMHDCIVYIILYSYLYIFAIVYMHRLN